MNTYRYLIALAGFLLLLLFPLAAQATGPPGVYLSEVAWAGSSKNTADEWLELYNPTDAPIDISQWTIEGAATSQGTLTIPTGSVIEPHTAYLVANYAADNASSALAVEPNFTTTSVSLSNSAFSLVLKDAAGAVVDRAGNGGKPFAGGEQTNGGIASMQRLDPLLPGDDPAAWRVAATTVGFDPDAPDLGTPGMLDEDLTPVSEEQPSESGETDVPAEPDPVILDDSVEEPPPEEQPETPVEAEQPLAETIEVTDGPTEDLPDETTDSNSGEPPADGPADPMTGTPGETETEPLPPSETEETAPVVTETDTDPSAEPSTTETEATTAAETAPDPEEAPEAAPIAYPAGTLVINEFVPDPVKGEVEWVEILNPYNNAIPLEGWKVKESSGRAAALPSQILGFGQFVVVSYSSGALNNDGDTIRLLDPNGNVIDEVIYGTGEIPAASDPASVARRPDGTFAATETPTRGGPNVFTTTVVSEDEAEDATDESENAVTTAETAASTKTTSASATTGEATHASSTTTATLPIPEPTTWRLSEIYPNTEGSDADEEFIELVNVGETAVSLRGWTIEDASLRRFTSKDETLISPQGMVVLKRAETNISLNNSGSETLRLYAPDGSLVDEITYENAPEGLAYARFDTVWRFTADLTPDEPNTLSEPQLKVGSQPRTGTAVAQPLDYNLDALRDLTAGTRVRVVGVVSASPGMLGSQVMYLASEDEGSLSGIQIFKSDAEFPELSLGDRVSLTGTMSSNRGEERVKVGKTDIILFLSSGEEPAPVEATKLGEREVGLLVRSKGKVLTKTKDRFTLETESGEILVRVKPSADVDLSDVVAGATVEAVGIVGQTDDHYALYLREEDDLVVTALPKTEEEALASTLTAKQRKESSDAMAGLLLAIATSAAILGFLVRHRLKQSTYEQPKLSVARPG